MCNEMRHAGGERVSLKDRSIPPALAECHKDAAVESRTRTSVVEKAKEIAGGVAGKVRDALTGSAPVAIPSEKHVGGQRVDVRDVKPASSTPVVPVAEVKGALPAKSKALASSAESIESGMKSRVSRIFTKATQQQGQHRQAKTPEAKRRKAEWQMQVLLETAEALGFSQISKKQYEDLSKRSDYIRMLADEIRKKVGDDAFASAPDFIKQPPR